MGSETELGVGQDESNRPQSPIYRILGSITNKLSQFGSFLGAAANKLTSYLACERPTASLPSAYPSHQWFRVGRMRLRISPQDRVASSNALVNDDAIEIDLESGLHIGDAPSRAVPPLNLGKTFLGVTYQAMYSFLIFHYQAAGSASSKDQHFPKPSHILLQIAEVNLVVGFAATLIGILLREAYREMSVIIETVGYVSSAFGFFVMVSMLLTDISEWIGWICAVGALLAFLIAFIKRK